MADLGTAPAIRVLRCAGSDPETKRQPSRRQVAGTGKSRAGLRSAVDSISNRARLLTAPLPQGRRNRHHQRPALERRRGSDLAELFIALL